MVKSTFEQATEPHKHEYNDCKEKTRLYLNMQSFISYIAFDKNNAPPCTCYSVLTPLYI